MKNKYKTREYYYTQIILVNIYIYKLGCTDTSFGCHTHVVSVSYLSFNCVQFAISCYNFSKIACVAVSYLYPFPCPCILVYKSSLTIKYSFSFHIICPSFYVCISKNRCPISIMNVHIFITLQNFP